jgi:hypothetical protein
MYYFARLHLSKARNLKIYQLLPVASLGRLEYLPVPSYQLPRLALDLHLGEGVNCSNHRVVIEYKKS